MNNRLTFNINEGPFNEDTSVEEFELIKKFIKEHPDKFEEIAEEYYDDPNYTEYLLLNLATECYK